MTLRPAPTTTVATALLVAVATMPLRDVFGDWSWAISVIGAAGAAALIASAIETLRPRLPIPSVTLVTAVGATLWGLLVSLRTEFWDSLGAGSVWSDLGDGVFNGWGALLDEQFPLTDPQTAETFVAFVVWIASAAAVHVAARKRSALAAMAAGAAVLAMGTAASLPRGLPPAFYGAGAGVIALFAVATLTRAPEQGWRIARTVALVWLIGIAGGLATIAGALSTSVDRAPIDPRSARTTEFVEILVPDILSEYGVRRGEDRTILTIESAAPVSGVRLRLQVYGTHNGERWVPSADFEEIATFPSRGDLPAGDPVALDITIDELDGPWIPVPDRLISIDLTDIRWNADAQTVIVDEQPRRYEVTGTLVSQADLQGLGSAAVDVSPELIELPADLPEVIREVAAEVTADSTDAIGAIAAIADQLRSFGRDESVAPGNSFGRLRDDLASEAATGAEQIASLHALMLRSVGIPSRVVVGYVANGPIVESDDLHIWVEAALADVGWVAFDPVPTVTETTADTPEDPTAPTTTQPDNTALQARALPRELGPGADPDEPQIGVDDPLTRRDAAVLAIVAVLALVGAMVAGRLLRRRVRRRRSGADQRVLGAWAELVDRLREIGAPIAATTTTGDIVYMAYEMDETLGDHTGAVAELAAIALHGPRSPRREEATDAWEQLKLAEARITAVRGRRVIPRRYLDPRVLRYRAPRPPASRHGGQRSSVRAPSRSR